MNEKPVELALCESEQLVLKADTLYVFRVYAGCKRCEELHEMNAELRRLQQANDAAAAL